MSDPGPQRLGLLLPHDEAVDVATLVGLARQAEAAGYTTVSSGEVAAYDAISLLTLVASQTRRIELVTGVLPMGSRSIALAAMGFGTLAAAAPGRVVVGVGVSSPAVITGWHGRPYEKPLEMAQTYVPALRRVLAGGVARDGEARPGDFRLIRPVENLPVVLAAMNSKMLELAGRVADGVYLALCTPEDAAAKVGVVRRAAQEAGRDPEALRVFASIYTHVGDDESSINRLRRMLLGYATLPTHRAGFASVLSRLDEIDVLWASGRRKEALGLIDDAEVQRLAAVGTRDHVAARVAEYRAAGVDTPVLMPVAGIRGDAVDLQRTVEGAAEAIETPSTN
jgi:probable F420-dependent oxidoreductase